MRLQGKAEGAVVMNDMLAERHDGQLRFRLVVTQADVRLIEQRQFFGGAFAVEGTNGP